MDWLELHQKDNYLSDRKLNMKQQWIFQMIFIPEIESVRGDGEYSHMP